VANSSNHVSLSPYTGDADKTLITLVLRFAETTSECKRLIPKSAGGKAIELIGSKI
jgi:hypothetical protein